MIEATAFKSGIVVAQVNEVVDKLPRVDVPGDRVDFVVVAPQPFYVEPLFTRDPEPSNCCNPLVSGQAS